MNHIATHRQGFAAGFTPVTRAVDPGNTSGLGFGVLKLAAGEAWRGSVEGETAWLLMAGSVRVQAGDLEATLSRGSLFDESASCLHVPAGTPVALQASGPCEFTVYDCRNTRSFAPRVFRPRDVPNEPRGKGQVRDRSLRFVRTIFDTRNSPAEVELVLGEVVTFPGGWSSYPPHHHPQPEIYHYRFTAPQGYGHAELGDAVVKVREFDTVCIPAGHDHAQCAAPGYGMYYAWVIRHLPGAPYTVPVFAAEHAWTMSKDARFWWPAEGDHD
ncbi:MAG: 5-deoxy-glucuronate isomerase [Steroidobacteraceae bacterium]